MVLVAGSLMAGFCGPARADWTPNGVVVCSAAADQLGPVVCPDGTGGVYVAWLDRRAGGRDISIYAHHVEANGVLDPAWPVDGLPVCALPSGRRALNAVPDGAGGVLLAWLDSRVSGSSDLFAPFVQRLTSAGAIASGWPANGLAVPAQARETESDNLRAAPDLAGGVWPSWPSNTLFNGTPIDAGINIRHISGAGALSRAAGSSPFATRAATLDATPKVAALISDDAGGARVAILLQDHVLFERRDLSNTQQWSSILLLPAYGALTPPAVASDGEHGILGACVHTC